VCIQVCEKWRATGTVCDIKKQSKKILLTEEKVRDIEARLQTNPRKSIGRLAKETGVSLGYAFRATNLFKFRPYKITVVHELTQQD
jgi:S-adenosylmethionine synthetase